MTILFVFYYYVLGNSSKVEGGLGPPTYIHSSVPACLCLLFFLFPFYFVEGEWTNAVVDFNILDFYGPKSQTEIFFGVSVRHYLIRTLKD